MRIKLTKTICDNAKPNNKRQFLNDSEHIGLNFVIGARRSDNTCSKSWYYTYRPKGQNPTKIYLAPYPSYSVAAARLKAKQVQRENLTAFHCVQCVCLVAVAKQKSSKFFYC